jgi:hypothetical protein
MVNSQSKFNLENSEENTLSPLTPNFFSEEEDNTTPSPSQLVFPSPILPSFQELGDNLDSWLG